MLLYRLCTKAFESPRFFGRYCLISGQIIRLIDLSLIFCYIHLRLIVFFALLAKIIVIYMKIAIIQLREMGFQQSLSRASVWQKNLCLIGKNNSNIYKSYYSTIQGNGLSRVVVKGQYIGLRASLGMLSKP